MVVCAKTFSALKSKSAASAKLKIRSPRFQPRKQRIKTRVAAAGADLNGFVTAFMR
jgi:hypothetical protein